MKSTISTVLGLSLVLTLACSTEEGGPISEFSDEGFFSSSDGVELSYVIDYPAAEGKFPIIVMGHGSGPKSKNDSKGFAERLLWQGFAVLRYDKRGIGNSTGKHICSCSDEVNDFLISLAEDMKAAAAFVNSDPKIDNDKIGLMGVSQAGWVISSAARSSFVDFFIVLSGPTVPLVQVSQFESLAQENSEDLDEMSMRVEDVTGGFDPTDDLKEIEVPGFWIFGDSDENIPVYNCTRFLDDLIANNRSNYSYEVLENADHALRDTESGDGIDYWPILFDWYYEHINQG